MILPERLYVFGVVTLFFVFSLMAGCTKMQTLPESLPDAASVCSTNCSKVYAGAGRTPVIIPPGMSKEGAVAIHGFATIRVFMAEKNESAGMASCIHECNSPIVAHSATNAVIAKENTEKFSIVGETVKPIGMMWAVLRGTGNIVDSAGTSETTVVGDNNATAGDDMVDMSSESISTLDISEVVN